MFNFFKKKDETKKIEMLSAKIDRLAAMWEPQRQEAVQEKTAILPPRQNGCGKIALKFMREHKDRLVSSYEMQRHLEKTVNAPVSTQAAASALNHLAKKGNIKRVSAGVFIYVKG